MKFLKEHYLANTEKFSENIKKLPFKNYMEVKRDGNCLYSSFVLGIAQYLKNEKNLKEFLSFEPLFISCNVCEAVYSSYIESIEEIIKEDSVLENINVFIGYVRLVISSYLTANEDKYKGFVENSDLKKYIMKNIDRMDERGGDLELNILNETFGYEIEVYDIENNTLIKYNKNKKEKISLLHSPDHFEPVFK